jgi:superfamily II DNA or RNA helicase
MSIKVKISSIDESTRITIDKTLKVRKDEETSWIYPYRIDGDVVYLPFHYAISLGYKIPTRSHLTPIRMDTTITLRDYQKLVYKKVIGLLRENYSVVLAVHVGWGKTMTAIKMIGKIGLKTVVLVNRVVLAKQWLKSIKSVSDCRVAIVGTGDDELMSELDVIIINAANVPKLSEWGDVGCVVVDELHLIAAEQLHRAMYHLTPRYLIGLSATPFRPDGLDKLIKFYYDMDNHIHHPLYREHIVYVVRTGFVLEFDRQMTGKINWNSLLNSQASHPERNQLIVSIIQKYRDRNFLVLCKRKTQAEELYQQLTTIDTTATRLFGTKSDYDESARVVLATSQKCGVGFSHDKLDALIIAADVEGYFIQYLGRVFRTPDVKPLVFDLVDEHPTLKKHWQTRRKVYVKSGGTIIRSSPSKIV